MMIRRLLEQRVCAALSAAGAAGAPAMVAPSAKPTFGDYQANGVMAAAKAARTNPRALAAKVVANLDLADIAEKVEVAGAGFINITLKAQWLAAALQQTLSDEMLGVERADDARPVVVDYSGPNLAKEMHVGHLRSTIIGDAIARALEFTGRRVIRQNHVGDWGTQFGMLIAHLKGLGAGASAEAELSDLEEFYRKAKQRFDAEPAFAQTARHEVVLLQGGDADSLAAWRRFRQTSLDHCRQVYSLLGVSLTDTDIRGESDYNADLPKVVEALAQKGMLTESQGAQCVFLPEFVGKDGTPLPVIIQKSDEGFLYSTSDLAALRYRAGVLGAGRVLYVVDSRQALHFRQIFAVAGKAGFVPTDVSLEHIAFGTMMGSDGKPFKTRTGGTVKLMDLLAEAKDRALALLAERSPDMPEDQRRSIAAVVGVGAVKYADLSQNRLSDYVFSWEKMLSLEGNTAPYMQYAYARVRSIFRKGGIEGCEGRSPAGRVVVEAPHERMLALRLLQFPEAVATVAADCTPHMLCAYLYDLASNFMGFYENCPVLTSPEPTRTSRLLLAMQTARVIRKGLELLGIATIEQM